MQPDYHLQPQTHTLPTMASTMTWEDKIVGDSFKNIIGAAIKHLAKNDALKITLEEAHGLFNLPAKNKAVSRILRKDASPQEQGMAIMAKFMRKNNPSAKSLVRKSFRDWSKVMNQLKKKAAREAKKAEKEAAAEAEKEAKKAAREAKKAEKQAAAEAEKQAKKDAREAKKAEKLQQIAKEKAEAKAANEQRKAAEKEAKRAEKEAKKAEKQAAAEAEKEAKKAAMADVPCDKCSPGARDKDGNLKMMGHRGRHTIAAICEPCSPKSESTEESKNEEFVECPKCPPGSGKKKGHRGKCKGTKAPAKPVVEENTKLDLDDLMSAMEVSNDSDEDSEPDSPSLGGEEDGEEESSGGEEVDFNEEMKVTIEGVDYYKTTLDGVENVIINYPAGDTPLGVLHEDGVTIVPMENDDGEE